MHRKVDSCYEIFVFVDPLSHFVFIFLSLRMLDHYEGFEYRNMKTEQNQNKNNSQE